ncbi:MAG: GTP 3',8-cyclase MoaA [Myxococcota bacterium]
MPAARPSFSSLSDRLGRPLRDLRISVTDRCNFRCPYCMPSERFGERYEFLPRREILTFEETERLARLFVSLGVSKIRITGGEPLLRKELPRLLEGIARIDGLNDLALTTNGVLLPKQAGALRRAGVRRVTVSLDSLDEEVFVRMNGGKGSLASVLAGIDAAERAELLPIKINCVVQRGVNDHTLVPLARHCKARGYILRFIEYMDVGTRNQWEMAEVVPAAEIVERIGAEMPLEPVAPGYRGEVAQRWRYADGGGEIGVIASVSQPFCGDCTRARLSTDGKLVTCLFASRGTDLRGPMRDGASDAALRELIAGVWRQRSDRYSEERTSKSAGQDRDADADRIEMYQIGG